MKVRQDNVNFVRVPVFYRITNGHICVIVSHNVPDAIKSISKVFSDEKKAIETFFSAISSNLGNIERMIKYYFCWYIFRHRNL